MKSTRANASKSFPGQINVKLGTRGLVALTVAEAEALIEQLRLSVRYAKMLEARILVHDKESQPET